MSRSLTRRTASRALIKIGGMAVRVLMFLGVIVSVSGCEEGASGSMKLVEPSCVAFCAAYIYEEGVLQ